MGVHQGVTYDDTLRITSGRTSDSCGAWLTSILGEQNIFGFEVCMDHLVAVQEDQASHNVESNQVPLAAGNTRHNIRDNPCRPARMEAMPSMIKPSMLQAYH